MCHKVTLDISRDLISHRKMDQFRSAINKLEIGIREQIDKCYNNNGINPNYLIVGYLAAEQMMDSRRFSVSNKLPTINKNELYEIGDYSLYKVYVDPNMDKNTILIQYDKKSMRDSKLNAILEDSKDLETIEINLVGGI